MTEIHMVVELLLAIVPSWFSDPFGPPTIPFRMQDSSGEEGFQKV
jgi:hypothetical protein